LDNSLINAQQCREIFMRFSVANPQPMTELQHSNPFELLVSVMLSAQATDKSVNAATARLFAVANTPETMLALGEAELLKFINTIGLHKTKAANLIKTCALLLQRHHGQVPRERKALEALPGVGRKTASVVLNTAFGEPAIAVDTHIFRVANRTGLAPGKTVLEVERKLLAVVPEEFRRNAHHWLVLHGRYVCIARRPRCASCIIRDLCQYPNKSEATSDAVQLGS
jgi:endonuclease-3